MTTSATTASAPPATKTTARIAGAPISWGVCEVPGWGFQLEPDRVLREMAEVGLTATEFGPLGFLPDDPAAKARVLAAHNLRAVGGFAPVVLHHNAHDPVPAVEHLLGAFTAAGADVLVLAAATGQDGYDTRPTLDDGQWRTLLRNLDRLSEVAAAHGVLAVLHPHVGTLVERTDEVDRVLDGSAIPLCLDTGHLLVGGVDPVQLTRGAVDRIAHTHLKDVDAELAEQVRTGRLTFTAAVRAGMFRPLGEGDVDIAGVTAALQGNGYTGWYVLEQDIILDGPPHGEGPAAQVRASAQYLKEVLARG